jgi:hypothetical protein
MKGEKMPTIFEGDTPSVTALQPIFETHWRRFAYTHPPGPEDPPTLRKLPDGQYIYEETKQAFLHFRAGYMEGRR